MNVYSVFYESGGAMENAFGDVMTECEQRREGPMDAGALDTIHQLDPPPPDVLLALLARNKALEGDNSYYAWVIFYPSVNN